MNLINKIEEIFNDYPEKWDKNKRKVMLGILLKVGDKNKRKKFEKKVFKEVI